MALEKRQPTNMIPADTRREVINDHSPERTNHACVDYGEPTSRADISGPAVGPSGQGAQSNESADNISCFCDIIWLQSRRFKAKYI